ncbi:DUF4959 domain-containing protein [Sunxiuqinia sp. A32]|uniref:DUF4959 domain-containing protein n=1 Tax=Sunxiuqinia sp. A32 TaxID=3461496 RepID=UPI004045212D
MKKIYFIIAILNMVLFIGCDENVLEPISDDNMAPGKVEVVQVTPLNGGFEVEYTLPGDKDLMYVKAEYDLAGGVTGEVKVSYFDNKLTVLGFGDTSERTVKLYAIDRAENQSEAVEFTASPLTPPVRLIQDSLRIISDFGGAKFTWVNRTAAPIAIEIFAEDSITHELVKVNTVYTSQVKSKFSIRNMESVPTKFGAVVRDRWDNVSDTIYPIGGVLTPLYEERLDKTKMRKIILDSDTRWDAWGFRYENLYDDDFNSTGHTQGDHPWPQIFTVDLGVKAALSRFRVYQRGPNDQGWFFAHGNPKTYDVYGAAELPADPNDLSQWQKLRPLCVSVKPSGLTENTDEDIQHGLNGDEYDFDQVENPSEIRYFRFVVWETWDGAGYVDFNELTWWGNIIEEYN